MSGRRSDKQADDCALKEEYEKLRQAYWNFGTKDKSANFTEINELSDGDNSNDELGHRCSNGACCND